MVVLNEARCQPCREFLSVLPPLMFCTHHCDQLFIIVAHDRLDWSKVSALQRHLTPSCVTSSKCVHDYAHDQLCMIECSWSMFIMCVCGGFDWRKGVGLAGRVSRRGLAAGNAKWSQAAGDGFLLLLVKIMCGHTRKGLLETWCIAMKPTATKLHGTQLKCGLESFKG